MIKLTLELQVGNKTLRLTQEEAKELYRVLGGVPGVGSSYPWVWTYPTYTYTQAETTGTPRITWEANS